MIDDEELERRTYRLLSEATHIYQGIPPAAALLRSTLDRLAGPLRLAVAGPPRSGRSTMVNALIGEELAPVELPGDPPASVTYRDGTQPRAWWQDERGTPYEIPMIRAAHGLRLTPDARHAGRPDGARRAVIEWPSRTLRRTELIDTQLPLPQVFQTADAVLYLTPHLDEADLLTLQAARGIRGPSVFPVHTMIVLSRADATGGGRTDALLTAKQAARRRRREPRVGALCQDVVAVSPLIAAAARTLRDDEFRAIATMAALPRDSSEPHLLSTDRFTAADALRSVAAQQRAELLQRLGLGGIRLAITLTRTGCGSAAVLGERLQEHSGLKDLQAAIAELFTARRAALRARSTLTVLDRLLRTQPVPSAAHLRDELELLLADAHEFHELRLLAALRAGRVNLPREHAVDAKRLLGGAGTSLGERLGMSPEATTDDTWAEAHAAAERWRQHAHGRALPPAQRRAAEVVLRSCDMILAGLDSMAAPAGA
ncbi:hypothetical protein DMB66_38750 [Actinoplanes sp. ATCC 53533]|uniref:hypothetical protein n=1 Tax=Actinoplanes sp. ATCC 53533 TaxID=1288362 RepID=UPI000F7AA9F3|nr:hypothetical protein [Actinoplanes sp. ATCC 53533]RSM53740.1 hypothetical protein DMB66_38750 [Actinoplanes sp. ATCC 53533]